MTNVSVEDRDGKPIIAEIFKDSVLVGVTNQGKIRLPVSNYEAKANGYDSKRFRVPLQPSYAVVMSSLSSVNNTEEGFFKKLKQNDKLVLGLVVAIVVFTLYKGINKIKNGKS